MAETSGMVVSRLHQVAEFCFSAGDSINAKTQIKMPATMKALFDYGVRCATEERLWADPLHVLDDIARPSAASPGSAAQCPAPNAPDPKDEEGKAR